MQSSKAEAVRDQVRAAYTLAGGCCGGGTSTSTVSLSLGYQAEELASVPDGADLGLGCGNPTALAALQPGETVLDLGSGGGLDALLAARRVGPDGRVIGVDMTPAMLQRARENAVKAGVAGFVEFREGIIEALPVVAESVDVVLSNCVINLSPDKPQVFREAFRVLKPGGRLAVSDMLLSQALPDALVQDAAAWAGCIGGAMPAEEYLAGIANAGFVDIESSRVPAGAMFEQSIEHPLAQRLIAQHGLATVREAIGSVYSYKIGARKP